MRISAVRCARSTLVAWLSLRRLRVGESFGSFSSVPRRSRFVSGSTLVPVRLAARDDNEDGSRRRRGRTTNVGVAEDSAPSFDVGRVAEDAARALVRLGVALSIVAAASTHRAPPASALLGAGGAAVSSPTVVKDVTLEEFLNLPEKKQRQYEGGFLSCKYAKSPVAGLGSKPLKVFCRPTNLVNELLKEIDVLREIDPDRADQFERVAQNLQARQRLLDRQRILEKLEEQPEAVYFTCALIASCVATCVMHPLDTLKVRLMTSKDDDDDDAYANESPLEFVKSLYVGLVFNLLKEGPPCALYLGVYEFVRQRLVGVPFLADNALLLYLLAGSVGEFVGSFVRSPFEAIKVRVQTGLFDMRDAVEDVFLTDSGRRNTLNAWSAGVFRDVPHGAVLLAVFELSKTYIVNSDLDVDVNTLLAEALLGGLGGGLGAALVTPIDVLTTKIITESRQNENADPPNKIEVLRELWEERGLAGLFRGTNERVIYWTLSYGIFLSVYCSLRQQALGLFE